MPLSALEYLRHIRDESDYLIQTAKGLAKEDFADDKTLQRAFVRSVEVIGEAAKQVPIAIKRRYP